MPLEKAREAAVKNQTEREFADIEAAVANAAPGTLEVLRVYGGLEVAVRQADAYLSLLNPISGKFSTTSSSNTTRS
jgi:hypothetical protein